MSSSTVRLASVGILATLTLALSGCGSTQSGDQLTTLPHASAMSKSLASMISKDAVTLPTGSVVALPTGTAAAPPTGSAAAFPTGTDVEVPTESDPNQSATSTQVVSPTPSSDGNFMGSALPGSGSSGSVNGDLVTGSVGQNLSTNAYTVKVNSIKDPVAPPTSDSIDAPPAGHHFVDVNVTVTNTGSNKISAIMWDVRATLTDNTSPYPSMVPIGSPFPSEDLYPGDTATADVIYPVPNGVSLKYLDLDFLKLTLGDRQTVRVKVSD